MKVCFPLVCYKTVIPFLTGKAMSKICLLIFLTFVLCTATSCKHSLSSQLTDDEVWKLGWRMMAKSMEENYEIADLQFDSLLKYTDTVERKFLLTGLEVKAKLGKEDEIVEILNAQNEEILRDICTEKFLASTKPCNGFSEEKVENKELQLEIIKMYVNDQYIRSNLMIDLLDKYKLKKKEVIIDSLGIEVDERNRNRLMEIYEEYGFPSRKLVGKDAMEGVFYIIQHSAGDKEWRKSQLVNIKRAVKKGDMDGQNYAYLYDRIQINKGEKQLYGTQIANVDPINKIVELAPTEDMESLDERRMEIGMMPIKMYKDFMLKKAIK